MKQKSPIQFFSKVSFVDKLLFTKHLSVLIRSGITLAESLNTLANQTKSSKFKKILLSLEKDIRNGQSLADTLKKYPKIFDTFFISLIDIGEQSGTLENNLNYLATHLSKTYALRKKVQGALLYPGIVLITLLVVGLILSYFVLPRLTNLFSSLNATLPLSTKILLFVSNAMKNHGILIITVFVLLLLLLQFLFSLSFVKPYLHRFFLRLPFIGIFIQNSQMASLCRDLGVMLKSGLSIREALSVQYTNTNNRVFKEYIHKLQTSVNKGKTIADELATKEFHYISPIATKMIGVGEKTGKLDEVLLYLADFFDDEVDDQAKNLSTILEPVILLIVGLAVAFVALSIISPIYQITGSIKR